MNEDTINLLKECNSGSKMAINSMQQVLTYTKDSCLKDLISTFILKHEKFEDKTSSLLTKNGYCEKEPSTLTASLSWFSTEIKMLLKDDTHQIAKLMMDGCNMGIQSISKFLNQYENANIECKNLASELIKIEESFMSDLKPYI